MVCCTMNDAEFPEMDTRKQNLRISDDFYDRSALYNPHNPEFPTFDLGKPKKKKKHPVRKIQEAVLNPELNVSAHTRASRSIYLRLINMDALFGLICC